MATFADGESGLSVRTKINNVLQHADGTSGELVINDAGADVDFRVESDTLANALFVDGATGNTGIGTNFPDAPLRVNGVARATAMQVTGQENITPASGKRLSLSVVADSYGDIYAYDATAAASINLVFQRSGGNVGIGTTAPSYKLDVSSTSTDTARFNTSASYNFIRLSSSSRNWALSAGAAFGVYDETAATTRLTIDSTGRLLIGTTTASGANLLQVNSDALVNGFTVGRGAGGVSSNSALGFNALPANTTGASNTAVGRDALQKNTTGNANTAVGRDALLNNVSGESNTSIGANTLQFCTGSNNTAIGPAAGYNLTTGSNNTIIGGVLGTAGLANTVIIGAGTTERLRIHASGNVSINSTADRAVLSKLQVTASNVVVNAGAGGQGIMVMTSDTGVANVGGAIGLGGLNSGGVGVVFGAIAGRYQVAGGNAGYLQFATLDAGGSMFERMRIDASGNAGLGVTPATWNSDPKVLQIYRGVALWGTSTWSQAIFSANMVYGASSNTYLGNDFASQYEQATGAHKWYTAPAGTAGGTITFTQAMTLNANGNLLVGTTTAGTYSGDAVIGFGPNGGIVSRQAGSVVDTGTVDIAVNTTGGGYQGFLIVSNTVAASANARTHTTFSVFGRGTDSSVQQIATDNGAGGGATFTVTTPSNGVIRVTNTSGFTTTVNIQFFGGTSL